MTSDSLTSGPLTPTTIHDLHELVDADLGPTDWIDASDELIRAFANTTGDRQWIHVDRERAAESPFGETVAHGLLTLALGPWLFEQLMAFDGFAYAVNYGYDRVRFTAPLPAGARMRLRAVVLDVRPTAAVSAILHIRQTFESDRSPKPVCVADWLLRLTAQTP